MAPALWGIVILYIAINHKNRHCQSTNAGLASTNVHYAAQSALPVVQPVDGRQKTVAGRRLTFFVYHT